MPEFEEVLYPGDRRDCLQCHLPGTYEIPLAEGTSLGSNCQGITLP